MHLQWINISGYNWAGFGLVFVTGHWAEKRIIIWQHWSKLKKRESSGNLTKFQQISLSV